MAQAAISCGDSTSGSTHTSRQFFFPPFVGRSRNSIADPSTTHHHSGAVTSPSACAVSLCTAWVICYRGPASAVSGIYGCRHAVTQRTLNWHPQALGAARRDVFALSWEGGNWPSRASRSVIASYFSSIPRRCSTASLRLIRDVRAVAFCFPDSATRLLFPGASRLSRDPSRSPFRMKKVRDTFQTEIQN